MSVVDPLLKKAQEGKRESKTIDFKASFNPTHTGECCEIIKDIVAMANSGGGVIVVGLADKGSPTGADLSNLASLDASHLGNLLHKYTESSFADVEIHDITRGKDAVVAIRVGPADTPLVFAQAGTYPDPDKPGKQKTAFAKGTVFFRHGAKSEPGSTEDIRASLDRKLDTARRDLMRNVQRAASAPRGAVVQVLKEGISGEVSPEGMAVRVTSDPSAPVIGVLDYDKTHPYRQRHLVEAVLKLLPKGTSFGPYDVQTIRVVHGLDSNRAFCHVFAYGGRQFSDALAAWIVEQWKADQAFFTKTRTTYLEYTRSKGWTGRKKK